MEIVHKLSQSVRTDQSVNTRTRFRPETNKLFLAYFLCREPQNSMLGKRCFSILSYRLSCWGSLMTTFTSETIIYRNNNEIFVNQKCVLHKICCIVIGLCRNIRRFIII